MMYRTYKYPLKLNNSQRQKIDQIIDACNLLRDICLQNNEVARAKVAAKELVLEYQSRIPLLQNCDFSALINTLFHLTDETGEPGHTKCRSYVTTYSPYMRSKYPISDKKVFLSKVGWVRFICHRPLPPNEDIFRFTICKTSGRYWLLVSFRIEPKAKILLDPGNSIGLDYSSTNFIVDNNGNRYGIEHFYRDCEREIAKLHRALARKKKGSIRYNELQNRIRDRYRHSACKRDDYLHKLSTKLADEYDVIAVESLDIKGIAQGYHLAKATSDNAYRKFVLMLEYKMEERRKKLIRIPKYYPSTKMCSGCGQVNDHLPINIRRWHCSYCGMEHDRDQNAAINILNKGLEEFKQLM